MPSDRAVRADKRRAERIAQRVGRGTLQADRALVEHTRERGRAQGDTEALHEGGRQTLLVHRGRKARPRSGPEHRPWKGPERTPALQRAQAHAHPLPHRRRSVGGHAARHCTHEHDDHAEIKRAGREIGPRAASSAGGIPLARSTGSRATRTPHPNSAGGPPRGFRR